MPAVLAHGGESESIHEALRRYVRAARMCGMSVPDFQSLMLPLLNFASDRVEHSLVHARESIAATFHLSDADVHAKLPSGQSVSSQPNGMGKDLSHTRRGLLDSPKRGRFVITKRGLDVLHDPPSRIDVKFLQQFPEFLEFLRRGKDSEPTSADPEQSVVLETPDEGLERAYARLRQGVASETTSPNQRGRRRSSLNNS